MKTKIEIMTLTLVLALFAGCVSTDGSRDEFFGYSNNPKPKERVVVVKERVIEREVPAQTKQQWKNPLAEDEYNATDNEEQYATSSPSAGYVDRNYVSTRYVPVIVPWWDRYSYDYMYYEPGIRVSYYSGGWWGSDWCWYNPWYDYHPYWGNRWYPHNNYGHWWHDPYYNDHYRGWDVAYHNPKPRSVRTFGPYRGSYGKTTTAGGNNINNPQRTLSTTSRSGYVTEKPYSGNMQSTRSAASGNRSTYLPSSTTRSTYTKQSNDYNKSNSGQKVRTTNSRTNQGNSRNEATQERSRYTPQSSSPSPSRSSEGNARSSGNAERSTYTPPPAPSGSSSSSTKSSGSSGSSGSSRSSSGSSGSSSTGRSSRSK